MSETLIKPPSKIRKLFDWFTTASPGRRILIYGVAGLILLVAILFLFQYCGNYWTQRKIDKDKAKIANTVAEISNVKGQISELEQKKAELQGELNRDKEALTNSLFGLDDAKREANQAIANFQKAVNSNTNTNATAQQIEDALRKLEQ
jgi:cell division protein FtsL